MGRVVVIGGGPAGLMAAEVAAAGGHAVAVYDAMPSVGRKLLMAGKSGLNITHAEAHEMLLGRYGASADQLKEALDAFTGEDVRAWCRALGVETFVGSSGRVFPQEMKASPLLRAWLGRLGEQGVQIHTRQRWRGWRDGSLVFDGPEGERLERADATILALGGASWSRLGSDGAWAGILQARGAALSPFLPANCGFEVDWSAVFAERFAGEPVKAVTAAAGGIATPGEFVVTAKGIEGSLVYVHAAALRDALLAGRPGVLHIDLVPARGVERLTADLIRQPAKASLANRLRKGARLDPVKAALVREVVPNAGALDTAQLATLLKDLPLSVLRPQAIEKAISTAGGVKWDALDSQLMIKALPGTFVAGEMIDWEAPTGGYLLTACLGTGRLAARGTLQFLAREDGPTGN